MKLPPIHLDPRFAAAVDEFNRGEYVEANDLFEELFFEATGDELEFARTFLQLSAGFLHAEQGQRRPAIERLARGVQAIDAVTDDRGYDLGVLRREVVEALSALREGRRVAAPRIFNRP